MLKKDLKKKKPVILIFADYYLPGYKSGGGMRTIVNMVDRLKDSYDFRIVTRDHDGKPVNEKYTDVKINDWNDVRGAKVFYLSSGLSKFSKIRELILQVKPDSIYLNSFFADIGIFAVLLRKLKLVPYTNIILAPCGELSAGALSFSSGKKNFYKNLTQLARLYKDIIWKASTELEKEEIKLLKPKKAKYIIAPDMPPKHIYENYNQNLKPEKNIGEVKMVFLSRINRKKNLKWLFENLTEINGELIIDIYGPLEDIDHWNKCLPIIEKLPTNIKVNIKGSIPHDEVLDVLLKYHFFIMPTLGENFGHIFLEAMASGCPLIISNKTPWRDLESKSIGWDLPLENAKIWNDLINQCILMDQTEYKNLSANSRQFIVEWLSNEEIEKNTIKVLEAGIDSKRNEL